MSLCNCFLKLHEGNGAHIYIIILHWSFHWGSEARAWSGRWGKWDFSFISLTNSFRVYLRYLSAFSQFYPPHLPALFRLTFLFLFLTHPGMLSLPTSFSLFITFYEPLDSNFTSNGSTYHPTTLALNAAHKYTKFFKLSMYRYTEVFVTVYAKVLLGLFVFLLICEDHLESSKRPVFWVWLQLLAS